MQRRPAPQGRGAWLVALLMALAGALPVPGHAQAPLDILQLYGELQVAQPNGFPSYQLSLSPAGPRASGGVHHGAQAHVRLLLDQPHAFLRIIDQGAGADTLVSELAVWLDAEGAPLMGLSEWGVRQHAPFGGRLRFYSRASGRWNLVTDQVWPQGLAASLCGAAPADVSEETSGWEGLAPLVALLPREGTDIAAWCVAPSARAGEGAMVAWDAGTSTFRTGQALAGPPRWPVP